jgi:hypothetical protein
MLLEEGSCLYWTTTATLVQCSHIFIGPTAASAGRKEAVSASQSESAKPGIRLSSSLCHGTRTDSVYCGPNLWAVYTSTSTRTKAQRAEKDNELGNHHIVHVRTSVVNKVVVMAGRAELGRNFFASSTVKVNKCRCSVQGPRHACKWATLIEARHALRRCFFSFLLSRGLKTTEDALPPRAAGSRSGPCPLKSDVPSRQAYVSS